MNLTTVYPDKPRNRLMRFVAWPFVFGRVLTRHWSLGVGYAARWANESLRVPATLAALFSLLSLAACTPATTARIDTALASADLAVSHFCRVNQPIVGRLTRVLAVGVAAAVPEAAPAVPVAGVLVALVDGTCAAVGGVDVAAPVPGTAVVVPGV